MLCFSLHKFWQADTYKWPHRIFVRNTDSPNRDYNLGLISMLQLNECTTVLRSSGTPLRYKLETSEAYSLQSVAYGAKKFTRSLSSWTKGLSHLKWGLPVRGVIFSSQQILAWLPSDVHGCHRVETSVSHPLCLLRAWAG